MAEPLDPTMDLGLSMPVRGVQLIEASAGTGKTFTVATLYARLVIEFAIPVPRLLAVTFTEAATKELREQLRKRLLQARQLLEQPAPESSWSSVSVVPARNFSHVTISPPTRVSRCLRQGRTSQRYTMFWPPASCSLRTMWP